MVIMVETTKAVKAAIPKKSIQWEITPSGGIKKETAPRAAEIKNKINATSEIFCPRGFLLNFFIIFFIKQCIIIMKYRQLHHKRM